MSGSCCWTQQRDAHSGRGPRAWSAYASCTTTERSTATGLVPEDGSNVRTAFTDRPCRCLCARSSTLSAALVGLTMRIGVDARLIFIAPVPKTRTPAAAAPPGPLKVTRQLSVPGPLHEALSLIAAFL